MTESLRLSSQKSALIGQLIDQNCWTEVAASPLFYMYPTKTVSRLNAFEHYPDWDSILSKSEFFQPFLDSK